MKKTIYSWLNIFLVSFFVFWILPNSIFAENEPNNSESTANTIPANGSQTGTLTVNDVDWFIVTIPDDGEWSVNYVANGEIYCDNLEIFEFNTSYRVAAGNWGKVASVSCPFLSKGQYLLKLRYYNGEGSYTLTSTFNPSRLANDAEPNDVIDQAFALSPTGTGTGRLGYLKTNGVFDNCDWYKITTSESGKLIISTTADDPLRFDNLRIYDSDKTTQLAYGSWGKEAIVTKDNILPGTYYIKVPLYSGNGSYTITTSFTVANLKDDNEPNNTQETAQFVYLSDTVYARLGYENAGIADNVDWYRVSVPENGRLTFKLFSESTLSVDNLRLYTENQVQRNSGGWGNTVIFETPDLAKGTYWLYIPKYYGYGAYKFIAEFKPFKYTNDIEPNNDYNNALDINEGVKATGQVGYWRLQDIQDPDDWYKINLPNDGKIEFNFLTDSVLLLDNPKLYTLVGNNLVQRFYSGSWGSNFNFKVNDLKSGIYYLKLSRYSNFGAYSFHYNTTPNPMPGDAEPNNSFSKAVTLSEGISKSGHLGYWYASDDFDIEDWFTFSTTIKDNATISVQTDSILSLDWIYLYNPEGDTVKYVGRSTEWGYKINYLIKDLEPGRYYIKVPRYNEYGWYNIRYSLPTTDLNVVSGNNKRLILTPNPVNEQTIIFYEVDNSCRVVLDIINISGQVIQTLLNENQQAGTYNYKPSFKIADKGIYFLRLKTGKKFDLIKFVIK